MGGPLLAYVDRRQEARPECLCPHPRGVRGEAEGADRGDEGRAGGSEAPEGGGDTSTAGAGKGQEERTEENEKGEKGLVKRITDMGGQLLRTPVGDLAFEKLF